MITTKNNKIDILDNLMDGNVESFFSIIGEQYEEFIVFYDIFRTLGDMSFNSIIYNGETGFKVDIAPIASNDIDIIRDIFNSYDRDDINIECICEESLVSVRIYIN